MMFSSVGMSELFRNLTVMFSYLNTRLGHQTTSSNNTGRQPANAKQNQLQGNTLLNDADRKALNQTDDPSYPILLYAIIPRP